MIQNRLFIFPLVALLTSCNLYGGIDKPKGDAQLLSAARGCLDRGDYVCAKEYYQALSSAQNDVKLSELSLTTMAENNAFSIKDLISSLGNSRGGGASFAMLSETMAARGKTDGATRSLLQQSFASVSGIQNSDLKAFMQFLTALATFNQVLSSAVGADGILTGDDITNSASGCIAAGAGGCAAAAACGIPSGSALLNSTGAEVTDMSSNTNWNSPPTLEKLRQSANSAATALSALGNTSYQGILDIMNQLNNLPDPSIAASCTRYVILTTLFPNN
jgi:hypothetical protein